MDVWNIYSVGDAHFLSQVLNAVAAICGTSDFSTACAVALLVGVIIICVQTVISGRGLPIQTAAVCYLFWMICYFPTVSVNIHDVYTQQDRKVDNVPLGPAVIGSVVSTFGFKVTEMMETAFQMPTATATLTGSGDGAGGRYANALYYLNSVIRLGNDPVLSKSIDEINNDQRGDFTRSLGDYVRYCTFRAVQLGPQWGGKTISQINELPISQALAFNSDVYYTQVWQNGTPRDYTCGDAWEVLYDKTTNTFRGGVNSEALTQLAVKLGGVQDKDPNLTWNYAQAVDVGVETADALEALRIDATNAQDFMLTSLAYDIFRAGMARGYSDYHDRTTAVAINQAIAQRNMQWASEQTMFFDTMRPIMSFIEGFVYAITPFAGFIMLLGVFGLKLFFKYFMLLVWIQLWLPVIAICNMFIMSGATRELSEFSVGGLNPTSFYALDHISQTVSTWIATGGMFAAATPLLTFIIVSGSAFAITSLTGRLNGADHFNEKLPTPDIAQSAAAYQMAAFRHGDSYSGVKSGAEGTIPTISLSGNYSNQVQAAQSSLNQASSSFTTSLMKGLSETGSLDRAFGEKGAFSRALSNADSQTLNSLQSWQKTVSNAAGHQVTDQQAVQAGAIINGGLGVGAEGGGGAIANLISPLSRALDMSVTDTKRFMGKLGFNVGLSGNMSKTGSISGADTNTLSETAAKTVNQADSLMNSLSNELASSYLQDLSASERVSLVGSQAQNVAQAGSNVLTKTRQYNEAKTASEQLSVGFTIAADKLAGILQENGLSPQLQQLYDNTLSSISYSEREVLNGDANHITNQYTDILGSRQKAEDLAMFNVLSTARGLSDDQEFQAKAGLMKIISQTPLMPVGVSPITDNTGVGNVGADYGLANRVSTGSSDVISNAKEATSADPEQWSKSHDGQVRSASDAGRKVVEGDHNENMQSFHLKNREDVRSKIFNESLLSAASEKTDANDGNSDRFVSILEQKDANSEISMQGQLYHNGMGLHNNKLFDNETFVSTAKQALNEELNRFNAAGQMQNTNVGQLMSDYMAYKMVSDNVGGWTDKYQYRHSDDKQEIDAKLAEYENKIRNSPEIQQFLGAPGADSAEMTRLMERLNRASNADMDTENVTVLSKIASSADALYRRSL